MAYGVDSQYERFFRFAIECVFGPKRCADVWIHGNFMPQKGGVFWELIM